jgi:anti-sigma B factor antagonist
MLPLDSAASWIATGPEIMECPTHLDSTTAVNLEEDVMLCVESGGREMILDARKLTYMTAAGLRSLLTLARIFQKVGGKLEVCNLGPQAKEIFEHCGFDQIITDIGYREETDSQVA